MENNLQQTILKTLIHKESFCRKVLPHIKPEYFEDGNRLVYDLILDFIGKYNKLPNHVALGVELEQSANGSPAHRNEAIMIIQSLETPENTEEVWLVDITEKWCKDRAVTLAIFEAISIIDGKKNGLAPGAIPEILTKALSVSFDTNVGHDYIESSDKRYDFYHSREDKVPFDLDIFNTITKGGVPRKTLNCISAGTGVGKSLAMCHMAAAYLSQGRNVLYITLEMSEERIAERIDANLFDVELDQLTSMPKDIFDSKVNQIAQKTAGKLIIKEYPTAAAHVGHFRALFNELKLKKNFIPDIVFIDYINICASSRMKGLGGAVNSYSFIKAIAEELRGLAVEFNLPIWTATQVNRAGFASSDVELTDTAESFGLPATVDFMVALITTENLDKMNQIMIKQLKNRYSDISKNKRFIIGVDRSKMRLYNVEASAQNLANTGQSFAQPPIALSPFGNNSRPKKSFEGFKL